MGLKAWHARLTTGWRFSFFTHLMLFFLIFYLIITNGISYCANLENGNVNKDQGEVQEQFMEEMVITATRRPVSVKNAPSVVSVISEHDIDRLPYRNIAELLFTQAGININQPQGQGIVTPQGFAMRGIGGTERTLILLNGQEWNSGYTSYFYLSQLPIEAVKRIEIVKGPYSSLYGGRAIAGVIHIFTKNGWDGPNAVSGKFRQGDFGRTEETLSAQMGSERASFAASRTSFTTNNYFLNDDEIAEDELRNRSHEHQHLHVNSRASLTEQLTLRLSGGLLTGLTGYGIGTVFDTMNEMDTERSYVNLRGDLEYSTDLEFFTGVSLMHDEHNYTGEAYTGRLPFPPIPIFEVTENQSGFDRFDANIGAHWSGWEDHIITFGFDYRLNEGFKKIVNAQTGQVVNVGLRAGEDSKVEEETISAYIQDDWFILPETLELVAGLRFDDYDGFGEVWSPKAALIWHYMDDGRLKGSAGSSFRPPDINDRFTPPWSMGPTRTRIANPELDPEEAWSYELAAENEFLDNTLETRVAIYYSQIRNYIESVTKTDPLIAGNTISTSENVGRVEAKGVETEVSWTPIPELKVFANYQYNETRDETEENDPIMDNHPYNRANLGATWYSRLFDDSVGLSLGFAWHYLSQQKYSPFRGGAAGKINQYHYADVSAALDFWQRRITVFADVYNVYDTEEHRTAADNWLPEQNYLAGVELRFEF